MTHTYSQEDIQNIVPHRFENILVDLVNKYEEDGVTKGQLDTFISDHDSLHREIFFKQKTPTQKTIIVPTIMEILALGSIVCSDKVTPGYPVFFTSISKFEKFQDYPLGTPIQGHVKKIKDKGGFMVCDGYLSTQEGAKIAFGEMMAFFPNPETKASQSPKRTMPIPLQNVSIPIKKDPALKNPWMYAIDAAYQVEEAGNTFVGSYTYPASHPFTRGHFPGNPIMMGVMQWMSVEDSCFLLAQILKEKTGKTGLYTLSGNADIIKSDGTSVSEIKNFKVQIYIDVPGFLDQAEVIQTEKIAFRDAVIPGDTILICLNSLTIQ